MSAPRVPPRVPHRCRALVRCLRLMKMVEGRDTVNLVALADQLRVSPRTIRRDLCALAAAGIAVPHGTEYGVELPAHPLPRRPREMEMQ